MQELNNWQLGFVCCKYSKSLLRKLDSINAQLANKVNVEEVKKAIFYAVKYHGTQERQSGEPFYSHPIAVAGIVSDYIPTTDAVVASILHDIVEDTNVTAGMLLDNFSRRVEELVDRLTRDRPCGRKLSIADTINNAFLLGDKDALLIKIADRLHNLSTMSHIKPEKQIKKAKETIEHIAAAAAVLNDLELERKLMSMSFIILYGKQEGQKLINARYDYINLITEPDSFQLERPKTRNV